MYDELWTEYRRTRTIELRNQLVEKNLGLVRYLANKMYEHILGKESYDDLFSMGVIGLIRAVERYNPALKSFSTFASRRIWGAMLDYLRDQQWGGRGIKDRKKIVSMDPIGSDDEVGLTELVEAQIDNQIGIDLDFDELLAHLMVGLSPQEKRVILLKYKGDRNGVEIAKIIGKSEAWVSQLHLGTMKRIRKRMEDLDYV